MSYSSCHSTILLCPWETSARFLWDVTSFQTERFFFIFLGSWDTWRLCFEIHIWTSNYIALFPWCKSLYQITRQCLLWSAQTALVYTRMSLSLSGLLGSWLPPGEMTELRRRPKERESQAHPGFREKVHSWVGLRRCAPGEWLRWESWFPETPVPLPVSLPSTSSCSWISLRGYTRTPLSLSFQCFVF